MGRINRGGGDGGEPVWAHQAGELSLAKLRWFSSEVVRACLASRNDGWARPFRSSNSVNGPWPWQGNALLSNFPLRIKGNLLRRPSGVTIRHNSGARRHSFCPLCANLGIGR